MTYQQTLDYLYQQLPMYQKKGKKAIKKNLINIRLLCEYLEHPEQQLRSIHIAGTNGKGSTAHGIAAILQQTGLKVGLYTSPHYKDFRERIKINGQFIEEQSIIEFVQRHKRAIERIQPSFFEITVALAFDYFVQQKVDIAVIETGLGGRLDSTNIIQPILSVITNISYDHTQLLGNTLEAIAGEKAGIIKENTPVVIGEEQPEIAAVFVEKANKQNAPIFFASRHYTISHNQSNGLVTQIDVDKDNDVAYPNLTSDLIGCYQSKNILTILQSVAILQQLGYVIPKKDIYHALQNVRPLTRLMGRWQILAQQPLTIADSAHNEGGLRYTMQQLTQINNKQLHIVFGVVKDKDLTKIFPLLPKNAVYYFCRPNLPRGLAAKQLAAKATANGFKGVAYDSVKKALKAAQTYAELDEIIYIGGSTFVVAEVI